MKSTFSFYRLAKLALLGNLVWALVVATVGLFFKPGEFPGLGPVVEWLLCFVVAFGLGGLLTVSLGLWVLMFRWTFNRHRRPGDPD